MAVRPLCFGLKFHDKGRSYRVRVKDCDTERYVVEVTHRDATSDTPAIRREYPSLSWALRDFAEAWRSRLN